MRYFEVVKYAMIVATSITVVTFFITIIVPDQERAQPDIKQSSRLRFDEVQLRTDSLFTILSATLDSLMQPQVQDTSAVVRIRDVSYLFDTLAHLSQQVGALNAAITPQNAMGIVTLQRLGDRYEMLTQTVAGLRSDLEKSRLASERTLADHAARINSELNRFTPMIWGMLGTIVLIVIQNVWTQRKKKEE